MTLQELPKTAAETTLKLVRLPVELMTKVREAVEERLGGEGDVEFEPVAEPTKAKTAKPKAPTPAATPTPAERAAVIDEQTDGLDEAVDRAQFQLHKRDVDANSGERR